MAWWQPFHKKGSNGWYRPKARNQWGGPLLAAPIHLLTHLIGDRYVMGVSRGEKTRVLLVDFDCKDGNEIGMRLRLDAALKLLTKRIGHAPILFQSSNSKGVHAYWFLKQAVNAPWLISYITHLLQEQGLTVTRGEIEVYPGPGQNVRLPLGKDSYLLNERLEPMFASRKEEWEWVQREARRRSFSWEELTHNPLEPSRTNYLIDFSRKVPVLPTATAKRRVPTPREGASAFVSEMIQTEEGLPRQGMRNRTFLKRIWWLYVTRALSPAEVVEDCRRWLSEKQHASKDLSEQRERCIARMLAWVPKEIAWIEGQMAERGWVRGLRGKGVRAWSEAPSALLTLRDALAKVQVPALPRGARLAEKIAHFERLLVCLEGVLPACRQISLASETLIELYGRDYYRPVRDAAVAKGLISLAKRFQKGKHSNIYYVKPLEMTTPSPQSYPEEGTMKPPKAKDKFWDIETCREVITSVLQMSERAIEGPPRAMLEKLLASAFTRADAFSLFATIARSGGDCCSSFVLTVFDVEPYYDDPVRERA